MSFTKKGNYLVYFSNLSGKFIFSIAAAGISVEILGVYYGRNSDQFEIETHQQHQAPRSRSNLLIKGVFFDRSKFIYQGLIRIEPQGQRSYAYLRNQNLIMAKDVFIDTRPYLEIFANDVFCTHGSTTGKINEEQLYYLASRGINYDQGKRLIINGFFMEVINIIRQYDRGFQLSFPGLTDNH